MQNIGLCIDRLIERHEIHKNFTPETAEAYAIVIRMEIEKLLKAITNVNNYGGKNND